MGVNMSTEELRKKIMDYAGTAAFGGFPAAFIDLIEIENATYEELVEISKRFGINTYDN